MKKRWIAVTGSILTSFIGALVSICADPYWEDNGVAEFIPWSERWTWAALFTPVFLVPIGVAVYLLWPALMRQHEP
jgi:hypothetical protein